MNRETARAIKRDINEVRDQPGTLHKAVVTSTSPLKVQVSGVPIDLTAVRCASYTPAVDDVVLVVTGMGPVTIIDQLVT